MRCFAILALVLALPLRAADPMPTLDGDDDVAGADDAVDDGDDDGADVVGAPVPVRTISLMPLSPSGTVTTKQASGVGARLREALTAIAEEGTLRLLPETKDDDKVVRRCVVDAACYGDVGTQRGADRLGFGTVEVQDGGGLKVTVHVTNGGEPRSAVFAGERADDLARFDRLARELFAEESLQGTLVLQGQVGDIVRIDGRRRGTIGKDGVYTREALREGRHSIEVRRPAGRNGTLYDPFTRDVQIVHREKMSIKVTLLPKDATATLSDDDKNALPVGPLVAVGVGSAAVVAGIVFGVLSLTTGFEVEERASQQQLVFPRDTALVQQGRTFAVVSSVLTGLGVVVAGGGAAWWALSAPAPTEDDDSDEAVGGTR